VVEDRRAEARQFCGAPHATQVAMGLVSEIGADGLSGIWVPQVPVDTTLHKKSDLVGSVEHGLKYGSPTPV
jgi:hypothetical protein